MTPVVAAVWLLHALLDSGGQLALKAAATGPEDGLARWAAMARRPWLWIGLGCYAAEFLVWIGFLSLVPLSVGVLLVSVNIVLLMLAGRWLFGEALTPLRVAGILLVAAGVGIVGLA